VARFGIKHKSRRKAGISGFHAEYLNDRVNIQQRHKLGLLRTIFSALALLLGACMIYVALHYIPAFVQPKKVLKFATGDSVAMKTYDFDRESPIHKFFGPFTNLLVLNRAYLQPGQSIEIKYDLPDGAYAKLDIVQCRRTWVIEIFKCDVIGQFSSTTKHQSGVESFRLKQGGFYYFNEETFGVPEGEPYRIVWERGL